MQASRLEGCFRRRHCLRALDMSFETRRLWRRSLRHEAGGKQSRPSVAIAAGLSGDEALREGAHAKAAHRRHQFRARAHGRPPARGARACRCGHRRRLRSRRRAHGRRHQELRDFPRSRVSRYRTLRAGDKARPRHSLPRDGAPCRLRRSGRCARRRHSAGKALRRLARRRRPHPRGGRQVRRPARDQLAAALVSRRMSPPSA